MLIHIPNVLAGYQVVESRRVLGLANWADGKATAGYLSHQVKDNEQLPETHPSAIRLGEMILNALDRNQTFISAALPLKVVPPLFNRYAGTQHYGSHIDGAVRPVPGTRHRIRTDLSATYVAGREFDYDGGELVVEDTFGPRDVKLAAGDMVLYPGTSVHHVNPVTRGVRLAAFFWIQSMVRDDVQRTLLFDLDSSVQSLARELPQHPAVVRIAGTYHNLLRFWSDT